MKAQSIFTFQSKKYQSCPSAFQTLSALWMVKKEEINLNVRNEKFKMDYEYLNEWFNNYMHSDYQTDFFIIRKLPLWTEEMATEATQVNEFDQLFNS